MSNRGKFRIEPFKHRVELDGQYAEKTWSALRAAIAQINNRDASGLSFEELYRNAYNMVLHRHGGVLYQGLVGVTTEHLLHVKSQITKKAHPDLFAAELEIKWHEHARSMTMIRDILMYMDRIYVPPNELEPVYDLGLSLWRDVVLRDPSVNSRMRAFVLDAIDKERRGDSFDVASVTDVTRMTMDVGEDVYVSDVEMHVLASTSEFYKNESESLLSWGDCFSYLTAVEKRLAEEVNRCGTYLHKRTERFLVKRCETELLEKPAHVVLGLPNSGLKSMLARGRSDQAGLVYRLYKRLDGGLQFVKRTFVEFACEAGEKLVTDPELKNNPVAYVEELLVLKKKLDETVAESFGGDRSFQNALHTSFEKFVNLNSRSPEFISLYVDDKLRKGMKGRSDEETDATLDGAMSLFRFLSEKDVFERYYKQHLSKRLLFNRSSSDDAEKAFVQRLKHECGYQYTSKIEGMVTDVRVSADNNRAFREFLKDVVQKDHDEVRPSGPVPVGPGALHSRVPATPAADLALAEDTYTQLTTCSTGESLMDTGSSGSRRKEKEKSSRLSLSGVDLSVTVLTTGSWPVVSSTQCVLSPVLQANVTAYTNFYLTNHTGRNLNWLTSMGTAELRGRFANQVRRDFVVSTHQMCVLLLFNDADCLSYLEIQAATGIPEDDLKRSLQSLSLVKGRNVLRKEPTTREVGARDVFHFNEKFTSKLLKVKIGTVIGGACGKETDLDAKATRVVVENDRKPQIEAAIVRVMKARRILDNNGVVTEVTKQLKDRFTPSPADIKKHLENLIEREFIERDRNDRKLFVYLA